MSNVTLSIGGRHYTVACAAGEEQHVEALGRAIDVKLEGQAQLSGQSEARTLLFAALLLADELHELRSGSPGAASDAAPSAAALEAVADRLEDLADRLEDAG
ncbi:MAG TPA: cell division protein ZapA [Croceibacterium sp.]|nr:cell division protein ZapA [Croceibacterium sp.]